MLEVDSEFVWREARAARFLELESQGFKAGTAWQIVAADSAINDLERLHRRDKATRTVAHIAALQGQDAAGLISALEADTRVAGVSDG